MLILDKPWTRQPQTSVVVNPDNQLAQGLFTGFVSPIAPDVRFGATNSRGLSVQPVGGEMAFSNATGTATPVWSGNHSPESSGLTVLVRAVRYGAQPDSGFGLAVTLVKVGGTEDPFQLFIKTAGERVRVNTTTVDTANHVESTQDWPVNVLQTGVYTWASGSIPKMYRNGALATGASSTYGASPPSGVLKPATSLRINLSGLRLNGAVSSVLVWNRSLSASEVAQVSANPWQLFAPRRVWLPVSVGGGLPTLSASTYKPSTLSTSGWTARITAS